MLLRRNAVEVGLDVAEEVRPLFNVFDVDVVQLVLDHVDFVEQVGVKLLAFMELSVQVQHCGLKVLVKHLVASEDAVMLLFELLVLEF